MPQVKYPDLSKDIVNAPILYLLNNKGLRFQNPKNKFRSRVKVREDIYVCAPATHYCDLRTNNWPL